MFKKEHLKKEHGGMRAFYYTVFASLIILASAVLVVLFIPLFLGFMIAFLANPIVSQLERKGFGRSLASILVLSGAMALLAGGVAISYPVVQEQIQESVDNKEMYIARFDKLVSQARTVSEDKFGTEIALEIETNVRNAVEGQMSRLKSAFPGFILSLPGVLMYGVFIPIFSLFFMISGREIKKFLVSLIPNRYFEMTLVIVHKISLQLGGYIRGQFWDCFVIGLLASVGLSVIGVNGAIPIGAFAGIANAVPYMGPVLGCLPAIISLLMDPVAPSPWWAAVVVFALVNMLDNILVYPMTVGKSLSLNPMVVMLGILFGGAVGGVVGMIVAVPLIGMIKQSFEVLHASLKSYKII